MANTSINLDKTTIDNLSTRQQLLLKWDNGLSHLHFATIQDLAKKGFLPKSLLGCSHPICHSCQLGKAHLCPCPNSDTARHIDTDDLQPGDKVSEDQIEFSTPGFVDVYHGKPTNSKYHAAPLYLDHASHFTYIKLHYSTGGIEAIKVNLRFWQVALSHGVKMKVSHQIMEYWPVRIL